MFRRKKTTTAIPKAAPLPSDLIPLCKASKVEEVKSHVKRNIDHLYVRVPTAVNAFSKKIRRTYQKN